MHAHEQLQLGIIERGLWKSPDIVTAQSAVIKHYEKVPVVIAEENIPHNFNFSGYGTPWFMRDLMMKGHCIYPSVRSRYAQLGLNIDNEFVSQVGRWLRNNPHLDKEGRFPNTITPFITVENRGSRPVALDAGTHLFRLFSEDYRAYLRGDELVETVKFGLIKIQGERLGDWAYSYGQTAESKLPRPTGIFIRVNAENRKWIPPNSNDEPVRISDSEEHYRKTIDSLLQPIPKEQTKQILWIGETLRVTLDSSIDAILDTAAIRGINSDMDILDQNTWGTQLNSRIIDGGKTDWQIRTEIISPTSPDKISNFVHLRFIKKPDGHFFKQ